MKPALFDYARPGTLQEVLALLGKHGDDAKLIAGGQSLVPVMNLRLATPALLIDLNGVQELAGIRHEADMLHIGAMTRQRELIASPVIAEHAPLLAQAVPNIGHVQTRSRGTIGGSLSHADPASELPLSMVTLNATFTISSVRGQRIVAAREFFQGAMATALATDEVLTTISFPVAPQGTRAVFRELARRHGDFAIVAVAAQFSSGSLTVAVGGLEAVPRYCVSLIDALTRDGFDRSRLSEFIDAELAQVEPLVDMHASAGYRQHLARVMLHVCLTEVLGA